MSKLIQIENIETLVVLCLLFILIGGVITNVYDYNFSTLRIEHDSYLNLLIPYKCREQTYEINEEPLLEKIFIAENFTLHHDMILQCYWNYTDFYIDCYNEGILILRMNKGTQKKNYTTGRYIDGKIECLGGNEICNGNLCNYPETWCCKYEHSQNFTLEELKIE